MKKLDKSLVRFRRPPSPRVQLAAYEQRLAGLLGSVFEVRNVCTETAQQFQSVCLRAASVRPALAFQLQSIQVRCSEAGVICVETLTATANEVHSAVVQIQCFLRDPSMHADEDRVNFLVQRMGPVCRQAAEALHAARAAIYRLRVALAAMEEVVAEQDGEG